MTRLHSFVLHLAIAWFTLSSTFSAEAVDPIVGAWDGIGYMTSFRAVFRADHTFTVNDSAFGRTEDFFTGTWTFRDGKYILTEEEGERIGTIDAQGKLTIAVEEMPAASMYFRRHGAAAPVPASAAKLPQGEWRYACTSKSSVPAACPPPFDIITFIDASNIRLKSTANTKEFTLKCRWSGNIVTIDTGMLLPKLQFSHDWADDGKSLLLRVPQQQYGPFEFEWTFLRPNQFLPNDIGGTWVGHIEEFIEEVQLNRDGYLSRTVLNRDGSVLHKNEARVKNYYRLWKGRFGDALTVVTYDPEMNAQQSQLFSYVKKPTEMILTPIYFQEDETLKPSPKDKLTWKLKSARKQ